VDRTERERRRGTDDTTGGEPTNGGDVERGTYRRLPYDRAFEPAIREGLLTVQQATQRNNRQEYADALSRRYGLPSDLALDVTDNRITFYQAIRELGRRTAGLDVGAPARGWLKTRFLLLVGVVALVVVIVVVVQATVLWNRHVETARELEQRSMGSDDVELSATPATDPGLSRQAAIERDPEGRITRVTAIRPELVMATICREALATGYCATLSVDQVMAEYPDAKVGRFTEVTDLGQSWIVHLRRDRRTGRWSAGDGHRPLQALIDPASGRSN
jgi:hypothetical protein